MAIPNLAPGYLNQVKAAQDRAELERERMRFEDEQRRKALQERVGEAFLGSALDFGVRAGSGALRDRAAAKMQAERLEAERRAAAARDALQRYQTNLTNAREIGVSSATPTYDPEIARKAIIEARGGKGTSAPSPSFVRRYDDTAPVSRQGRDTDRLYGRGKIEGEAVVPPPALEGPPVPPGFNKAAAQAALRKSGVADFAKRPGITAAQQKMIDWVGGVPSQDKLMPSAPAGTSATPKPAPKLQTREMAPRETAPTQPRQVMRRRDAVTDVVGDPQGDVARRLSGARRFDSRDDETIWKTAQARREFNRSAAIAKAREAAAAETKSFREYAAGRSDKTYADLRVMDAMKDASQALANGMFERGRMLVSLREWIDTHPDPDAAFMSLSNDHKRIYMLGQTDRVERNITADQLRRYDKLFSDRFNQKSRRGRRRGGDGSKSGPRKFNLPNRTVVILNPGSKTGQSTIDLSVPRKLQLLRRNIGTNVKDGMRDKALPVLDRVYKASTARNLSDDDRKAAIADMNKLVGMLKAGREQTGGKKEGAGLDVKPAAVAEKKAAAAEKAAKTEGKEGRKVLADLRKAWREKEKSLQSALERSSGLPGGSLGLRKSQVISAGVTRINSGPGNQREKKAAVKAFSSKVNKAFRTWGATKREERSKFAKSWAFDNRDRIQAEYPAGGPALLRRFSGGSDGSEPAGQSQFMGQPPGPAAAQPPGRRQPSVGDDDQAAVDLELKMDRAFREINARNLPASVKRRMFDAYTRQLGVA